MWKRRKRGRGRPRPVEPLPLELCDLCAATFPADRAVRGYVADSSAVHPTDDWLDGLRPVTACTDAHFAVIRDRYRHRPFVQEELWAAKIERALTGGTPVLTMVQLGCRTGLHEPEIRRAIAWHNAQRGHGAPP
ncbi:hypothetical protein [Streptomyces sp. NPDC018610]|uniref:hypothetical protein n=1 Tax=Streptomyces sp. NPDC018610 TaxID=3365049 RepID=UPI003790AE84